MLADFGLAVRFEPGKPPGDTHGQVMRLMGLEERGWHRGGVALLVLSGPGAQAVAAV